MILRQVRVASTRFLSNSTGSQRVPWFISPENEDDLLLDISSRPSHPTSPVQSTPHWRLPLPEDTPEYLRILHAELCTSPYLEASTLTVTRPIVPSSGPPLPFMRPRGSRRKRGGTDFGTGIETASNSLWSWFLLAEVKEGTERKGSINSVVKVVQKKLRELASRDPSLALPPNRKQVPTDGWAMLDVGDFAVHILSRAAREKWFPNTTM